MPPARQPEASCGQGAALAVAPLSITPLMASGLCGSEQDLTAAGLPRRPTGHRVLDASYPGKPESAGCARRQATAALAGVPCAEDVVAALNEVIINAVMHSRSGLPDGEFAVAVDVFPGSLVAVAVTDQGGPWKEGGPDFYLHGLGIVREMAAAAWIIGGEDGRMVLAVFGWEAHE